MTQYAKFINENTIEFPPKNKGNIINYNLNEVELKKDGYKQFIPAEKEVGKAYVITYTQTKTKITEIATEIIPDPAELLRQAKERKYNEAVLKANEYIQSGEALYEFETGKHIEATDGNIGKFTAYALAYVTGQLQPTDTVVWNTKEDETVQLTQLQVSNILVGLGQVQAVVWTVKYPAYINAINEATTIEEVENIIIDYKENE